MGETDLRRGARWLAAADDLQFEYAAKLRDEIKSLRHELAEVEASA
jgi:excinuclease UvrABC helicase subunit UvrB